MHKYKSKLKDYFTFTSSERNGTLVLAFLILVFMLAPSVIRHVKFSRNSSNSAMNSAIDSFFRSARFNPKDELEKSTFSIAHEEVTRRSEPKQFPFDPNTVSLDSLVELGLSVKQAAVILRYREKGGHFDSAADLAKIYVLDSSMLAKLKPLVQISVKSDEQKRLNAEAMSSSMFPVELNTADTTQLMQIIGIGRSYANRITTFRNLVGGFYSINQLTDIYGITPELVASISTQVRIDSMAIRRINLNQVTYEELRTHPYLTDYQAKAIIYYRSKKGNISNPLELVQNKLVPTDKFQKLYPYLTVR